MSVPVTHFCHARDCQTETAPDTFFCPVHFAMLPLRLQDEVLEAEMGGPWKDRPSISWRASVNEANRLIAWRECV